jgi:D-alanyl-D-alanine carboxypeptidase
MFLRISGTLQYRIPPTNKFAEERALNHTHSMIKPRQGSDYPYEGVLAGKTGFTQASQNTLATAAQRDGRSLIAVTLSSPDGNDRYEDTVRLLDYGFTQFGRFSVTGSDLDPMTDTLVLADGDLWQVAVTTGGTLELLTENTVTAADLVLSCELNAMMQNGDSVSVQISLPEDDPRMYGALGELPGTLQLVNNLSAPAPDAETEPDAASPAPVPEDGDAEDSAASDPAPDAAKSENGFWYVLRLILVGLLVLAAGGFIVILVMRTLNIRRHKKRMQARRRR